LGLTSTAGGPLHVYCRLITPAFTGRKFPPLPAQTLLTRDTRGRILTVEVEPQQGKGNNPMTEDHLAPVVPLTHSETAVADRILVAADWVRYDLDRGIIDGWALYEIAYLMPSISRHNPRQAHLGMGDYITAAAIREATIGEAPGAAVPASRILDCYSDDPDAGHGLVERVVGGLEYVATTAYGLRRLPVMATYPGWNGYVLAAACREVTRGESS
jgi:hypothetical protein